jgi:hypothetical protein
MLTVQDPIVKAKRRAAVGQLEGHEQECLNGALKGAAFSLKGTGFSPYINPAKPLPALAPEGAPVQIDPLSSSRYFSTPLPLVQLRW